MKTDWNLIRSMMATAIDTCEKIEALGYTESDRDLVFDTEHGKATVFEFMVSAFTYPENMRYGIIRTRHDMGADLPYVPEFSRILVAMAQAGAELIGAQEAAPADDAIKAMIGWYNNHAIPNLERAMAHRRTGSP